MFACTIANMFTIALRPVPLCIDINSILIFLILLYHHSLYNSYHSKYGLRQAVSQSRLDTDAKSLYTIVYDDTEAHLVLACFSPLGRGWCYYPGTGTLRMYYDTTELRLYSEVYR